MNIFSNVFIFLSVSQQTDEPSHDDSREFDLKRCQQQACENFIKEQVEFWDHYFHNQSALFNFLSYVIKLF